MSLRLNFDSQALGEKKKKKQAVCPASRLTSVPNPLPFLNL